jgi:hypothetical protein
MRIYNTKIIFSRLDLNIKKVFIKKFLIILFVFFFIFYFKLFVYSEDKLFSNLNKEDNDFILEPVLIFFSNSPEYIKENGYLIGGYISKFTPTLIYFYHLNDTEIYKELVIRFYNFDNSTVNLNNEDNEIYIDGLFSSGKNYFKVGADVNNKMLKNFNPNYFNFKNEYIIKIPFKSKELLSGFLWIFSRNGLNFESYVSDYNSNLDYRYLLKTDNKHVKGIFGVGRILTYLPINQDIIVGDIPLSGIQANMLLKGTYKVMYHFVVDRKGEAYFNPRGGISRPSFIIYNKFSSLYFTRGEVFREYTENKLTDQLYIKEFITLPEGASYYPVRYIIK